MKQQAGLIGRRVLLTGVIRGYDGVTGEVHIECVGVGKIIRVDAESFYSCGEVLTPGFMFMERRREV